MVCPAALFSAKTDGNSLQHLCMSARPANDLIELQPLETVYFSVFEKNRKHNSCEEFQTPTNIQKIQQQSSVAIFTPIKRRKSLRKKNKNGKYLLLLLS